MHPTSNRSGFTLVEAIFSLSILAVLALGVAKTLSYTKYLAEDNLYEASALTVAISAIEQIKGASIEALRNPQKISGKPVFEMVAEGNTTIYLVLEEANQLEIPIITEADGSTSKRLPIEITPAITPMTSGAGFWIEVQYSFEHPRSGMIRTRVIRNARSVVPSA